eukprot:2864290-Amphidinium_carterae.1
MVAARQSTSNTKQEIFAGNPAPPPRLERWEAVTYELRSCGHIALQPSELDEGTLHSFATS